MATLKNAQDVDRTNRIKELAKEIKDQAELVEHRKMENKKHVEQSVKERQKVFKKSFLIISLQLVLRIAICLCLYTTEFSCFF